MCLGRICEVRFPSNAPARRGAGLGCRKRSVAGPTSESRRSGHGWLRDNPLAPGPPVRRGDGLGKVLHPGPTYEHSSAKIETKAECIAHATNRARCSRPSSFTMGSRGSAGIRPSTGGRVISRLQPTSYVISKTAHGWQVVARQSTKVQSAARATRVDGPGRSRGEAHRLAGPGFRDPAGRVWRRGRGCPDRHPRRH
jgi:hypothetical protein